MRCRGRRVFQLFAPLLGMDFYGHLEALIRLVLQTEQASLCFYFSNKMDDVVCPDRRF